MAGDGKQFDISNIKAGVGMVGLAVRLAYIFLIAPFLIWMGLTRPESNWPWIVLGIASAYVFASFAFAAIFGARDARISLCLQPWFVAVEHAARRKHDGAKR
jgi:hypothetical protein